MDKNLISINIVAYNAEKTLSKTLEGVKSQLDVMVEIIFINDSSTDSTLSIIEKFKEENPHIPCTIITNQINLGITKSRNIALKESNGNYIAILDSDDVWVSPIKLISQLNFLLSNSEYGIVGTQMNIVNQSGLILKTTKYKLTDKEIRGKMLILNQFGHSSILMKKPITQYNESLYIWEDYDLILSLGSEYKFSNLNEYMVNYLYSPKKYSFFKKIKLTATELQIIKKYRKLYPNFWVGYCKGLIKYILIFLHLK